MAEEETNELLRDILEVQQAQLEEYRQQAARAIANQELALAAQRRAVRIATLLFLLVVVLVILIMVGVFNGGIKVVR